MLIDYFPLLFPVPVWSSLCVLNVWIGVDWCGMVWYRVSREYGSLVLRNTNPDTIDAEMEKERGRKNTNHVQSMMELKE